MHGQQPGEPGDQRLGGPHPPDPQATPDALAERADRDHAVGVGGQRRRHLHPGKRQIAEHLVVDQRDTGRRRGLHQRPPGERGQHRAGRVVKGRDHVGEDGVLLARCGQVAEPDRQRTRHGCLLPERLQRAGVGGSLDQHPVARCQQRAGEQRQSLLGAGGDQDVLRAGADSAPGVAVGDRAAQRRVAGRVIADVAGVRPGLARCGRTPRPVPAAGCPGAAQASGITPSPGSSRCRKIGALVVCRTPPGSAPATRVPLPCRRTIRSSWRSRS